MADTLVGSGYDQMVGTRQSTVDPTVTEFYNKQSGQGFTDPNSLSSFVNQNFQGTNTSSQNVFDILKGQYTPVTAQVSPTINSSQLAQDPKTVLDVQSLLAQNRKLQEQYLSALQPSQQETDLQTQLNALQNQARSTQLNAQAGLNQIEDQAIPMQFITGQQAGLQRQANLALQTNAFQQQPLVQQLQMAQQLRQSQQDRYNSLLQFGRDDINLAMQMEQSKKQEQAQARQLAFEYGVTKPFYNIGGTIYRTSDGKAYSTPDEFFADGGSRDWSNVQQLDGLTAQQRLDQDYRNRQLALQGQKITSGGSGGGGVAGSGLTGGGLDTFSVLAEAVSNRLGSVSAKNSFLKQFSSAQTDDERLRILAANAPLSTEMRNGLVQNAQVSKALDSVLGLLDNGVQTGLLQAGRSYVANKLGTGGDKQVEEIKSRLIAALQPYRNKVTGAAWGEQEEAEYQALVGSVRFTPEQLANKLQVFQDVLRQQSLSALQATIDPLGSTLGNSSIDFGYQTPQLSTGVADFTQQVKYLIENGFTFEEAVAAVNNAL